jgi:hypothetical protein
MHSDYSYQKSVNALVNPDYISYTTDGKNKITDSYSNLHSNEYALRLASEATTEKVQTITKKFPAQLKSGSVFKELYIQYKADGLVENYHVRVHYEPQDARVVALFNSRPESDQKRQDGSGYVLHLDPEISQRDREFFDNGEYQTKYIPGMLAIIKMAEELGMMESEETEKLMIVLKDANLIKG